MDSLLRGYELAGPADTVKSRRLQGVANLLTRLGLIEGKTATSISVARRIAEKLSG